LTQRNVLPSDIVKQFGGELLAIRNPSVSTLDGPSSDIRSSPISDISQLNQTRAGGQCRRGCARCSSLPRIICANPYAYYAKSLSQSTSAENPYKSAVVAKSARIAKSSIGACAVIGKGVQIVDSVIIGADVYRRA
jgi:hypothetical protein